jgi:hypothetical protein
MQFGLKRDGASWRGWNFYTAQFSGNEYEWGFLCNFLPHLGLTGTLH